MNHFDGSDRRMTRMTQHNKRKWHTLHNQVIAGSAPKTVLDMLLALDRAVLELSMHIYDLPARDRFAMREQNQRLHDAVKEHLPQLRKAELLPAGH